MRASALIAAAALWMATATPVWADDRLDDLLERQAETIAALEQALEYAKMQEAVIERLRGFETDPPEEADSRPQTRLFTCRPMGFGKMCQAN